MQDKKPLVSICCITYNHEKFIRDAIEGFLMQETTFPIEIIIHDDASTDNTVQIIKEYADKYPDLFVTIFQSENQWSKGGGSIYARFVYPRARGKYIALCEGDDYWTDPFKLQKQVDFLKKNEDCSWCFTGSEVHKSNGERKSYYYKFTNSIDVNEYLKTNYFIPTASLVFKREVLNEELHENWMDKAFAGDFILKYKAISIGNLGFVEDQCVVYNQGNEGSWSSRKLTDNIILKEYNDNIAALNYLERKTTVSPFILELKKQRLKNSKIFKTAVMKNGLAGLFILIKNYNKNMNFYIGAYIKKMIIN